MYIISITSYDRTRFRTLSKRIQTIVIIIVIITVMGVRYRRMLPVQVARVKGLGVS